MAAPAIRRRRAFASNSSIRSTPHRCSGRSGRTSTSGRPGRRAAALAGSEAQGRHARAAATTGESGLPGIPGVTYTGFKTTRYRFNYGPNFYPTGIPTINPPVITPPYEDNPANGPIYPSYVPKIDSDGNDIAGIRLPELTVPLATYTGWGLRSGVWANDGCEASGQYIPFKATGRAHCRGRSAAVGPGALSLVRDVSHRGDERDRRSGEEPVHALRGHRVV